jgi:hypothetical protein
MKIILSRKGFDSQYGGRPSPIMPDGSLCSLTIPQKNKGEDKGIVEGTRYRDVRYHGESLGEVVETLTRERVQGGDATHLDPDLRSQSLERKPGWRPAFGQVGAAQSHLERQGVGPGDLFLFFGWFRQTVRLDGRLTYDAKAPNLHVIFGWLQIDKALKPTVKKSDIPGWAGSHPHVTGAVRRLDNNTLYVARQRLKLPGFRQKVPGGGAFERLSPPLRLTAEGEKRGIWRLPRWLYPEKGRPPLSYHGDIERWERDATGVCLQSVNRGQEFVLDCDGYPDAFAWLQDLFAGVP